MTIRVAFLAFTQGHQFLHWIPVALRLSQEPDVEVTVLSSNRASLDFIKGYDPDSRLKLRYLWVPTRKRGLFSTPKRAWIAALRGRAIGAYPFLVTTEVTSALLYLRPGFRSKIIHLKHGAGDREGSWQAGHGHYDLTLVNGSKDKERLIARGHATDGDCLVVGYAKFELLPPPVCLFADDRPIAFYNPHWLENSSFPAFGEAIIREMEKISGWNFVVAPHVRMQENPGLASACPNIIIDRCSVRSIDMTYVVNSDVYIGDMSSQVYEFLQRPRPCIFLNLDRIDWRGKENYLHWELGQVIETLAELGPALDRAMALQPQYEARQIEALRYSIAEFEELASERQANVILDFINGKIRGRRHLAKPGKQAKLTSLASLLPRRLRVRLGLVPEYRHQGI